MIDMYRVSSHTSAANLGAHPIVELCEVVFGLNDHAFVRGERHCVACDDSADLGQHFAGVSGLAPGLRHNLALQQPADPSAAGFVLLSLLRCQFRCLVVSQAAPVTLPRGVSSLNARLSQRADDAARSSYVHQDEVVALRLDCPRPVLVSVDGCLKAIRTSAR